MSPLGPFFTLDPLVPFYLLAAVLTACLGGSVAMFERFTEPSRRFFLVAFFMALWLGALGVARAGADPETAHLWLRVAYLWVPLTMPAVYWMAAALAARAHRTPPWLVWSLGIGFSAVDLFGPWLVDGLETLFTDWTLARWGWVGASYVLFELGAIVLTVRHLSESRRGALSGAERRERLLLTTAALVGALTMLDYVLARDPFRAGVVTPVAVLAGVALVTLAAVRYRMFAPGQSFATDEVLSAMSDAVLVCDGAGLIRGSNPASHLLLGRSEAWLHGQSIGGVLGATTGQGWDGWIPGPESERNRVMELRPRSGEPIQVSVSVEPIQFGSRPVGAVVVARDIRNRLRSEHALQQAQLRYRALYHHHPALVHEFGTDGRVVALNPATRRVLGLTGDEPVEHSHWSDYVHPEDVDRVAAIFDETLAGASEEYEVRLNGPEGWRVVRGVVVPVWDDGAVVGIFGVGLDVTAEEHAKRELEVQRRYFAELFESSPEAVVLVDADDTVVRVNPEFTRLFGYRPEEVVGGDLNAFIVPDDLRAEGLSLNRAARTGGIVRTETVRRRKDGSVVDVSVLARNIQIPGGRTQLYGIYRDISDRKAAEGALREREEELRHAQKLEAVGKLAGGIAHDFNNLLTVINGHARFALENADPDCAMAADLTEIEKAGARAGALTQQLLAFSRRQVLRPQVLDPNEVVREVHGMLRRLIGAHIQVETRLTDSEVRVRADRGQLEQVLVNLVVNARDAMPDGGTLTLATAVLELAAGDPRVDSWEVRPGAFVRLTVEDTGCGMDAETAARAFEPFFTTKEQGKGTGLGLATVFGIVKQSGGHVAVRTAPGAGTRCDVMLPMAAEPASRALDDGGGAEAAAPGGTILVVEDEDAVRKLAVRILERDGYTVLAAENGVRALEHLRDRAGLPDLVLTDLVMPEMGGRELARRLRDRHPGLPVLFMSGYDDELGADTDGEPGLLAKPFTPVSLSHQVAELLRTAAA